MRKVVSIRDLEVLAHVDKSYKDLALKASENLGKKTTTLEIAINWLKTNAMETSEEGVVDEINFLLPKKPKKVKT